MLSLSFSVVVRLMPSDGMMNLYKYIDVIQRKDIPDIRKAFPDGGGKFQQDIIPCLSQEKVKTFSGSKIKCDRLTWKLARS